MLKLGGNARSEQSLEAALDAADQAERINFDYLSDAELERRIWDTDSPTDALGIVSVAARRRIGVWRALLSSPLDLAGGVRVARETAARLLDSPDLLVAGERMDISDWARFSAGAVFEDGHMRAALEWLLKLELQLRTEYAGNVRLPSEFYRALLAIDDAGCLDFLPKHNQITAAALLMRGTVVEMDAGEGKSLAATMAAAAAAADGRAVHVLTANDYLADRDCATHAPVFESLGITVGLIVAGMDDSERRLQYAQQVVFATAKEIGFDYLRDGIAQSLSRRVNPVFDMAIADESDHLLVDQARTPLIISGEPGGARTDEMDVGETSEEIALDLIERQADILDGLFAELDGLRAADDGFDRVLATVLLAGGMTARLVSTLESTGASARKVLLDALRLNDEDEGQPLKSDLSFVVDVSAQSVSLTESGWRFVSDRVAHPAEAFEVIQILRARLIHTSDDDYLVGDDGIVLVDSLDGRPMYSHRYMDGLHEALESKEGVESHGGMEIRAQTTIRALMSGYSTVSGLTGTAIEASDMLREEYGIDVIRIPPESESKRIDLGARVFRERNDQIRVIVDEVESWRRIGRPTLITVGKVSECADMSDALTARGVPHHVLSAANPSSEPQIVADAGAFGAVTLSTGMAGRGTDIIVPPQTDAAIVSAVVDMARRQLKDSRCMSFSCVSNTEADMLRGALEILETTENAEVEMRREPDDVRVTVCRPGCARLAHPPVTPFGLGLMVILGSVPASARVERQIRGRTGRRGGFGASRLCVYIHDTSLAFSREQARLLDAMRPPESLVDGRLAAESIRRAQDESESRRKSASKIFTEYGLVVESDSRAYYAAREDMMREGRSWAWMDTLVASWVERNTVELDDPRADYRDRFDGLADRMWAEYGIDIGGSDGLAPVGVRRLLANGVGSRLLAYRDRMGGRRFGLAVSRMCIRTLDDAWPARLTELQDMWLSALLGASLSRSAVARFADAAEDTRADLYAFADDIVIGLLLTDEYVENVELANELGDNHIERLPGRLASLLSC